MSLRRTTCAVIVVLLLAACGGGGDDSRSDATAGASTGGSATTIESRSASSDPAASETTVVPSTSIAEGVIPNTPPITLFTSGSGLGARPLLRWDAVESATAYVVSVNALDGGPLWTWQGSATEVPFGGGPADDPDTTGAQLTGPATWFVAAIDADGLVLATSAVADLEP